MLSEQTEEVLDIIRNHLRLKLDFDCSDNHPWINLRITALIRVGTREYIVDEVEKEISIPDWFNRDF